MLHSRHQRCVLAEPSRRKPGLFSGRKSPSSHILVCFGVSPGNPPQNACIKVSSEQLSTCTIALSKRSRKAATKEYASCLKQPIDPGANLRYHCRVAPVLVGVCGTVVRCHGWHLEPGRVRHHHDGRSKRRLACSDLLQPVLLAHKLIELPLEVIQPAPIVVLLFCRFVHGVLSTEASIDPGSPQSFKDGSCGSMYIHGIPRVVARVVSEGCRWNDSLRGSGPSMTAPQAYSLRFLPNPMLSSMALPVRSVTSPISRW
ncbi:hypothetical protein TIFTF001_028396 [Ficus carica]|uniref:Uncharacterized protein n=1 Tax=Ficus carica TaxID=3494 RepID=A0AA88DR22_FICCA|nr:hypothetical protein TIFTF001_028396 [Ficus carica]